MKKTLVGLLILVLLGGGVYFYRSGQLQPYLAKIPGMSQLMAPEAPPGPSIITKKVVWDDAQSKKTIKPTAIVLHWWGFDGGGDINKLVRGSNKNISTYNPKLKSTDKHPKVGSVTVQIGVTKKGKAYQLTPQLNSWARHAKCANDWGIGIEIEGKNAKQLNSNKAQFDSVVRVTQELMAEYNIKAESVVATDGKSGRGILSHAKVDKSCKWADGKPAGSGKNDVDQKYLDRVLAAVK